jgi:uncharacterized protein (TIGR02646 family)
MKYIKKSKEPQVLSDFKNDYKKKHHIDAKYKDITSGIRVQIKSALSEEQNSICCYCMKRIKEHNSHIEHIQPQAKFPTETLNYHNLLVSCNGIQDNNENCGHKKEDWYNVQEFLTPLNSDCEKVFSYNITGAMNATSKNGKITIDRLNLNALLLVRARKAIISQSGLFDSDFETKKQELIEYNITPNSNNELPPFCMAVIYCINNYSGRN